MREWVYSVGKGWAPLVQMAELAVSKAGGEIDQVKEKFGALRIYVSKIEPGSPACNLIDALCDLSDQVCEYCGAAGRSREDRSWVKTLCDHCSEKDLVRCDVGR